MHVQLTAAGGSAIPGIGFGLGRRSFQVEHLFFCFIGGRAVLFAAKSCPEAAPKFEAGTGKPLGACFTGGT